MGDWGSHPYNNTRQYRVTEIWYSIMVSDPPPRRLPRPSKKHIDIVGGGAVYDAELDELAECKGRVFTRREMFTLTQKAFDIVRDKVLEASGIDLKNHASFAGERFRPKFWITAERRGVSVSVEVYFELDV